MIHTSFSHKQLIKVAQKALTEDKISIASDILNIIQYWDTYYAEKVYLRQASYIINYLNSIGEIKHSSLA